MKRAMVIAAACSWLALAGAAPRGACPCACPPGPGGEPRFEAVNVYVDSGQTPLAAYEIEVVANVPGDDTPGNPTALVSLLSGVEGGEHAAFKKAPFYDPKANLGHRIVLAALSTDDALPTGKTRVARIHVTIPDGLKPEYTCKVVTAGDRDAKKIEIKATASVEIQK